MLRRASTLVERARERIRLAAEHDPHAWPDHGPAGHEAGHQAGHEAGHEAGHDDRDEIDDADLDTRAPLVSQGNPRDDAEAAQAAGAGGADRPPMGSPEPAAPDVDGVGPGVSGPPSAAGSRPRGGLGRRFLPGGERREHGEPAVPEGLRLAASWSWRLIVVLGGLYALLVAMATVAVVVVPVIVALLLAALLQPGAAALVRRRWPRSLAALTMLIVGLGVVAGIIAVVVERFTAGFSDLVKQVSEGITQIQDFIVRTFPITHGQLERAVAQLQDTLLSNKGSLATGALNTAATVGEVFTGILLALFTLFFFLKDGRSIWLWVVGLCPRDARAYIDEAARRSWRTLISYVRATVTVAAVDAIFIGVGLAILGVPLVVPLAALVFLGAFIPIIGSFLAGTVAVLVALVSKGFVTALIALAIVVLVMQIEGHVLQPLLLGRAVRVHPLAVVLSIAAGLLIAGIFGALIAVPIVACANVAGTYLSRRHEGPRPPEPRPDRARKVVSAR